MPTIDLSASSDETAGQAAGRRIGGAVLMIVCGALTLGLVALWIASPWLFDSVEAWSDVSGAFIFFAFITFILTAVGFELMRRGRKRKGEVGPQSTAVMGAVSVLDALTREQRAPTVMSTDVTRGDESPDMTAEDRREEEPPVII